ncbi:MAG: hypothetical protein DRR42_15895 [Gammaproteobacteria bacterium]|nr:MAG: hypothetical protein DRR42_15895 [Gammaproteobacteria bacterium]
MEPDQIVLVARAVERVAILFLAGLCIWAGYRLFFLVSKSKSEARLKGQDFELSLINVGPGVIFAMFGALVLITAIVSSADVYTLSDSGNSVIRYGRTGLPQGDHLQEQIVALNRLRIWSLENPELVKKMSDIDLAAIDDLRAYVFREKFGNGSFIEYQMISSECETNPSGCTKYLGSSGKSEWFEKAVDFIDRTNIKQRDNNGQ